jgi:hypothetical protein
MISNVRFLPSTKLSVVVTALMVSLVLGGVGVGFPGSTACLLVGFAGLQRLSDDVLTDSQSDTDQYRYVQLVRDARSRIEATFGPPEAKPVLVFFSKLRTFWFFKPDAFGSTQFMGNRACVLIGPKGAGVDVVAHELMHAEIHYRVGYLKRFFQIPTWFDEGVAMQVDHRSLYLLSQQDSQNAPYVRSLKTPTTFFNGDELTTARNYESAKLVVAAWLQKVGTTSLYARLRDIKAGTSISEMFCEQKLDSPADQKFCGP